MGLMSAIRKALGLGGGNRPSSSERNEERQRADEAMEAMNRRR
jgi:hypothetical protein